MTAREACEAIDGELSDWWDSVATWLDTFTELDLLRNGFRDNRGISHRFVARTVHVDGTVRPISWMSTSTARFPDAFKVPDLLILRKTFILAGAQVELPPAWRYLGEARSWLNNGETRRAVIDACTAAEIALAHQIRDHLREMTGTIADALLNRCNGIAALAKAVRELGGTTESRGSIEQSLAKIRNDAAHDGREPQQAEAERAVEVAWAIVEHAIPRNSLMTE